MRSARHEQAEIRGWIASEASGATAERLAERFGYSLGYSCQLLRGPVKRDVMALAPMDRVPMPRWCQPRPARPRYLIDGAFPRDPEYVL